MVQDFAENMAAGRFSSSYRLSQSGFPGLPLLLSYQKRVHNVFLCVVDVNQQASAGPMQSVDH